MSDWQPGDPLADRGGVNAARPMVQSVEDGSPHNLEPYPPGAARWPIPYPTQALDPDDIKLGRMHSKRLRAAELGRAAP